VPIPLEYDEDGNPLTEQLYHDDFAVDIVTPILIEELNNYILTYKPEKFYNSWSGSYIVVENVSI